MSACPPNSETGRFRREKQRPDWRPYCLKCSTMGRMTETEFGFRCDGVADHFGRRGCGNTINWDLTRYDAKERKTKQIFMGGRSPLPSPIGSATRGALESLERGPDGRCTNRSEQGGSTPSPPATFAQQARATTQPSLSTEGAQHVSKAHGKPTEPTPNQQTPAPAASAAGAGEENDHG